MHSSKRKYRAAYIALCLICLIITGLFVWKAWAEEKAHWIPEYKKEDIRPLLNKEQLNPDEYGLLFRQTGLGSSAVDKLLREKKGETILRMQSLFFSNPPILCRSNTPISWEERINMQEAGSLWQNKLTDLEDGDILVTPCSHTYGWRNGHAAIVIDAENGLTLESVVLGENSSVQKTAKWETFPSVVVLRLKDVSAYERARIAQTAEETMKDIPYGFLEDILEHRWEKDTNRDTHCSHLVWKAYRNAGYDLDSDGGLTVTPGDIARSPLLETVQIYGIDPDTLKGSAE